MESVLKALIEKLPVRALSVIVVFVVTWIVALTIAGLVTHRAVEFFPPKIGSDPILQKEIAGLSAEVKSLSDSEMAYRMQIFTAQEKSMSELISIRRSLSSGDTEAKNNIEKYAELLRNEDAKISKSIEELKSRVASVEKQL